MAESLARNPLWRSWVSIPGCYLGQAAEPKLWTPRGPRPPQHTARQSKTEFSDLSTRGLRSSPETSGVTGFLACPFFGWPALPTKPSIIPVSWPLSPEKPKVAQTKAGSGSQGSWSSPTMAGRLPWSWAPASPGPATFQHDSACGQLRQRSSILAPVVSSLAR